jgi:hypothetical protein
MTINHHKEKLSRYLQAADRVAGYFRWTLSRHALTEL